MKKIILLFLLCSLVANLTITALPNCPINENTTMVSAKEYRKTLRKQKRLDKKTAKFKKKFQNLEKKLAKGRISMKEGTNNVWQDENFKIGALIALGGLLLTILGVLPLLGGVFAFIGGLMMLVGIGLMIWVLIESYQKMD